MIIAKIVQQGQIITLKDALKTFQYSANLQMQFVKDTRYKDYILVGYYKHLKGTEYLLDIQEDGTFNLGRDIFAKQGSVYFSFSLNNPTDGEIIHLGVIEYNIEQSFGSGDAILPEQKDTWISVVTKVTNAKIEELWDKDYKPQLEENLNIIEAKTSEINRTAAEVKQDALESSANAKSALDSANLAKNSADNAALAKEKALEHSTNAERFKNDASNYANQADLAKTEAQQSATDANNNASSALTNANKAKEHLDSIVEKTNAFNIDYTNKVNSFNSNVESANTALNTKISTANTDIDKKVLDTNNALDTKIADANTSIDGKVTVATEQANIATTKATELSQAVDKVKHLEDVVDTKLTQPYVSSPVIENGTLADSDVGLLRNLKIYGKCTQKVETDIVPTSDRPVPIVSKKIVVNNETVELRSLKESANLFDYRVIKEKGLYTSSGSYISYAFKVKPNTNYYITKKAKIIPTETPDVFIGGDQNQPNGMYLFRDENVFKTTSQVSTADGYIYFKVNSSHWDNFVANIDNVEITITESTSPPPSSYVAPAVRDYKIVDHVNKKAWIERNVIQKNLAELNPQIIEHSKFILTYIYTMSPAGKEGGWNNIFCNNFAIYPYNGFPTDIKEGIHVSNYGIYVVLDDKRNVTTIEGYKEWIKSNPIIVNYQVATPVIEEIPYIESDTSEFGVSSQDSTSPSPNIKSEVETITTLNIKVCNINLLSNKLEHWYFRKMSAWGASSGTSVSKPNTFSNVGYSAVIEINNILPNTRYSFYNADTKNLWVSRIIEMDSDYIGYENHRLYDAVETNNKKSYNFTTNPNTTKLYLQIRTCPATGNGASRDITEEDITNMQITLALGEIKEHYAYQESSILHELEKPLVKCGDIADTIDLNNLERINNNYFGLLDLVKQNMQYSKLVANYLSYYWRANTMPKPKIVKNSIDKNNLICDRFIANLGCYNNAIGETISIYHDSSADFIAVFNVNRFKDVNEFKRFFVDNPTMVAYPLAEPTVEPLEPELVEKLKTLMSSYPITHIFSNVPLEFDYKLNMPAWHKVVSGQVEDARNVIYNMQVQQNNLEVMQLQSALETQYNMDLLKLGGM